MKPHRLDLISAFFGIVFLGLGVAILADRGSVSAHYLAVLGPVLAVAFGLVLVASAVHRRHPAQPAPQPDPQPVPPGGEPRRPYSSPTGTAPLEALAAQSAEEARDDEAPLPDPGGEA